MSGGGSIRWGARATARAALTVLAAVALALSGAASAAARVVRAETVMPPGQSGYVAITGLVEGTGSPHLYDQQPLFTSFRWKSAMFDRPQTESSEPKPGVTIGRDAYGIPTVHAGNERDMWWGAAYAVAQDRLFELELFRRATTGRLAALLGRNYVPDDAIVRQNFYSAAELDAQFARLPADLRDRFSAYADGVNAWIAHVRSNPNELPGEFAATGASLDDWTVRDSLAVGVFLARTIATNADPEGQELANMRAVQLSGGAALQRLVPLRTTGALTTIPRSAGAFPSQPGRTVKQERAAFKRSLALAATLPFPAPRSAYGAAVAAKARGHADALFGKVLGPGGSSMFAVRGGPGQAFLFNGPQLGFAAPEKLVELELHAPGIDLHGMTAPGVPVIGAGFNGHVAWGVTTGASDADDLYAEQLVGGTGETYRFKGQDRPMACHDEAIAYRSPPSSLLGLLSGRIPPLPESGTQTVRVCRTVHGPVEFRAGRVAYARRYAIWDRELDTLLGLADINAAKNVADVNSAAAKLTWNENIMAADDQGNIGYWHPGLLPLRPRNYDERLPYPGTGGAEWRGLLSARQLPHVINPRQRWLANWNNVPSVQWTSGDGTARKRMDGGWFRAALLFPLVARLAQQPSFAGMQNVIRQAGTVAQQAPVSRIKLSRAERGATNGTATILQTLLRWDGSYTRTDDKNTVDPGVAAWDAFRAALGEQVLKANGPGARYLASDTTDELSPGYHFGASYHLFDASHLQAYGLRTGGVAAYRAAAATAFDALKTRFGSEDPARWRLPRPMFNTAIQGAESPPPLEFFDRGTYEQFVELGPG
jgi:penicillin amidase